jgi:hypothetical protein
MHASFSRRLPPLAAAIALLLLIPAAIARAIPVEIGLTSLRAIQTSLPNKADEQAFLLVTGVASGKEFSQHLPADQPSWTIGPKKPVASDKQPIALWKGELGDGEFALVTVALFQGKSPDAAKVKEFESKLADSNKSAAARSKPRLAKAEFDNLHDDTLHAQQKLITTVKKILPHDKDNPDHYGGLFDILVWNNAGQSQKRVDPVGLTFGEHYGVDPKIYTKIKNTRANVMIKDDATGEWAEQQVTPLNDDQDALRVKMLETELIKTGPEPAKNTIDYLAEIQVKANGKALKWELGGIQTGPSDLHTYWDFAE